MVGLLTSWKCQDEIHLVVGSSNVAQLRVTGSLKAGAHVKVIGKPSDIAELKLNEWENKVQFVDEKFQESHLTTLGRLYVDNVVDKVFVVLPLDQYETKSQIYKLCKKLRIPVNTSDSPEFSSFTLLSTHTDGDLQIGVTTNGKGCRLATRIKRELVSSLPSNIGAGCAKVGELRTRLQQEDNIGRNEIGEDDEDAVTSSKINSLVEEFNMSAEQKKLQRTRWLLQIVEYYPLGQLSEISIDNLTTAYHNNVNESNREAVISPTESQSQPTKGRIALVGAGPGSTSLLTLGALREIYGADLILADKLVPQQVLDLIPQKHTRLFIARKFPGNAERAQDELLELGLEALQKGEKVVRLKQGDPYIFGRGGEEFNFFRSHGYIPHVLPGITLALAAPVLSNIPATHRDVADQVLICTGTGRRGAVPDLPEYKPSRTTVFLMALHRIVELVPLFLEQGWDGNLPVAIVERASSPDQRIIRTKLKDLPEAVEANGSRPPGLLVTGNACSVIEDQDFTGKWQVQEGYDGHSVDSIVEMLKSSSNLKLN